MAERAGLENRRWGNLSASSNLAPSAKLFEQFGSALLHRGCSVAERREHLNLLPPQPPGRDFPSSIRPH